jgi:hypothetical protein
MELVSYDGTTGQLNRNDAVKNLNFDRINRIYRMEKRIWHQKRSLTTWVELRVPNSILFIL